MFFREALKQFIADGLIQLGRNSFEIKLADNKKEKEKTKNKFLVDKVNLDLIIKNPFY